MDFLCMAWTKIGTDDPLAAILISSSELTTKHGRFHLAASRDHVQKGIMVSYQVNLLLIGRFKVSRSLP
jgi:hypothetical protein